MTKAIYTGLLLIMLTIALLGCGLSPEEQAATAVALTKAAATSTPTSAPTITPTWTPTPVPYDLALLIRDRYGDPIIGASVSMEGYGSQTTDDAGEVNWYDLPGDPVDLSIDARGYFPTTQTVPIARGENQITITLDQDPNELLEVQACTSSEHLIYLEDFQDGHAQGWLIDEGPNFGQEIQPVPAPEGDMVLQWPSSYGGAIFLDEIHVENSAVRIWFMIPRRGGFVVGMNAVVEPYTLAGETVEYSAYTTMIDEEGAYAYREARPEVTDELVGVSRRISSGEWHLLEVSAFEGVFEIWVDQRRYLSYQDPSPLRGGSLRLANWKVTEDGAVLFDDISICEMTEPFTPIVISESD
ncbi:MAG: hypothetical protein PVI78_04855 [Anaerolineales bacterium]|jgi:hypothetical protein